MKITKRVKAWLLAAVSLLMTAAPAYSWTYSHYERDRYYPRSYYRHSHGYSSYQRGYYGYAPLYQPGVIVRAPLGISLPGLTIFLGP